MKGKNAGRAKNRKSKRVKSGALRKSRESLPVSSRPTLRLIYACSSALIALFAGNVAWADDLPPEIRSTYGTIGLVEMPSARMAPDGELALGVSVMENVQHYNAVFQALPWLEASFRYSGLQHFYYSGAYPTYPDRSFGIKMRLWEESAYLPDLSVGINDVVGTGLYSSEYLVASKRFGRVDASIGLGWGRLASTNTIRNPFSLLSHRFDNRPNQLDSTPGGTAFSKLFHGRNVGVFGGLTWQTPIEDLSLITEYSSDQYAVESGKIVPNTAAGSTTSAFLPRNQFNFGVSYRAFNSATVGLNWMYGRTFGANVVFPLNPPESQYAGRISPTPPAIVTRTGVQQQQSVNIMLHRPMLPELVPVNNAALVDSLFVSGGTLMDVRVQGQVLELTTRAPPLPNDCTAVAELVRNYGGQFQGVVLTDQRTRKMARCAVPAPEEVDVNPNTAETRHYVLANLNGAAPAEAAPPDRRPANATIAAVKAAARRQDIDVLKIVLGTSEATLYYTNNTYFSESDAVGRLARILMAEAPAPIERFHFIAINGGLALQQLDVLRQPMERAFAQNDPSVMMDGTVSMIAPAMRNSGLIKSQPGHYPHFDWAVFPTLDESFFDPKNPVGFNVSAAASGSVDITPGWSIYGEVHSVLASSVPQSPSNSLLPHVRTDFPLYSPKGRTGFADLESDYRFRAAPDVYGMVKVGYLENMFAGGGGQILWRPHGERWALGADLYEVWQRNFNELFGLHHYHAFTGHISLYYQSPWYGLNFTALAGQYLAGDRGLTLEVTRRFTTGVEVGAFFTKTNVSATQFGEGSFDKGIIIRIPIGWVAPITSQKQLNIDLRPLTRDGGQRLLGDTSLYEDTRRSSEGEILNHLDDFLIPE